jgi:hypothetical protein
MANEAFSGINDQGRASLISINEAIPQRENTGGSSESHDFFVDLLAPSFSMRRASGEVIDRQMFLGALNSSKTRSQRDVAVTLVGSSRAVVTSEVEMDGVTFHNLRVFIATDSGWRLLAWANERAASPSPS